MHRRTFLEKAVGLLSSVIGAALIPPFFGYLFVPIGQKHRTLSVELLPEDEIPLDGEVVEVNYLVRRKEGWLEKSEVRIAYVVNVGGKLFVLSDTCTHAGCGVRWDSERRRFICPCHGGEFDIRGKVLKEPPPRPLERLPYRLTKGKLVIKVKV